MKYYEVFTAKIWEPRKRNKDGMRWISHRFPIKGGISYREVMHLSLSDNNIFLAVIAEDVDQKTTHIGDTLRIRLPLRA